MSAQTTTQPRVPPHPPADAPSVSPGSELLNRELSWLEFNRRVLHEALDPRTPLLERVLFLSIVNSNLDEFYQKRVGGLKRQIAAGVVTRSPDGLSPGETLSAVRRVICDMLRIQADCYRGDILPALKSHGIELLKWHDLTHADREFCTRYFRDNLFAVLTPLAVDPGHPFPFISNLSLSVGVMLRHPGHEPDGDGVDLQFARVKVPRVLPRWVRLPDPKPGASPPDRPALRFVHLCDIIRHHLDHLFEGMIVVENEPFRVTRNAAVEREEEDAEDLLELIEQELRDRRFADVVRLEVDDEPGHRLTPFLMQQLNLDEADVYHMSAELDYTDLGGIASLGLPELKHEPWTPLVPPRLADEDADIYDCIRQGDILVHHPYESFKHSVERFISDAVGDPRVVAIKQTLYRTSSDSPFIPDLIRAAERGKQVVALVELKARFDEEKNIQVAQQLEKAGVHVVYGVVGLKTHTKTAVVVRQESDGMKVYAHIGTGNYNSKTAQLYTDLGLFTCRPEITADLVDLFHYLTGRSLKRDFSRLLIAPLNMRQRFVQMIDREIAHAERWRQRGADPLDPERPRILAKMNSLEDQKLAHKLYQASRAGVAIDLIVRGFCCLRPGVPGLSDNIRVTSVIGRFLEHSRIYCFHNHGKPDYYIGSADWMYRNLNARVECITPVLDPALQARLRTILDVMLADRRQAWDMHPDGTYSQRRPAREPDPRDPLDPAWGTHKTLMELTRRDASASDNPRT